MDKSRMTAKDYTDEYDKINKRKTIIKLKIIERVIELGERYPNVLVSDLATVGDYSKLLKNNANIKTRKLIKVIELVEQNNRMKSNFVQTKMF